MVLVPSRVVSSSGSRAEPAALVGVRLRHQPGPYPAAPRRERMVMRFFNSLNRFRQYLRRSSQRQRPEKFVRRPTLEALEDRRLMATVTSPNVYAPIIPNVQIETVYYGSAWTGQASNPALSA